MQQFPFRFGAEVYTWFMHNNGQTHQGRLGHMIGITADAGFKGIEPIHSWMGNLTDAGLLKAKLDEHGLELAAIALALEWNGTKETDREKAEADQTIALLGAFPGAVLCTVQIPAGRHDIVARRKNLISSINTVSQRAADKAISCSFHPNSPHTSITRTEDDYAVLLEGLDTRFTGWTPDVGHIINGGMDPLQKMKQYESLINHVHYKDWNGQPEFALMGKGTVDFIAVTRWLADIQYSGWIICEDEGPEALNNPDFVTMHDGRWIKEELLPAIKF